MYFIVLLAIYKHPYNSMAKMYVQNIIWSLAYNSIVWMQLQHRHFATYVYNHEHVQKQCIIFFQIV